MRRGRHTTPHTDWEGVADFIQQLKEEFGWSDGVLPPLPVLLNGGEDVLKSGP